jgi:hypothetical protein
MVEKTEIIRAGIGLGSVLAITISWSLNKSIFGRFSTGFAVGFM